MTHEVVPDRAGMLFFTEVQIRCFLESMEFGSVSIYMIFFYYFPSYVYLVISRSRRFNFVCCIQTTEKVILCSITFFCDLLADLEIEVGIFVNMIFFPRSFESLFTW